MTLSRAGLAAVALLGCGNAAPTTANAQPAAEASSTAHELRRLTVDQVATRLAAHDGKTFIYDNNSQDSWVKGHVPGAKWLDDEHVTSVDLPADKAATLIFYCHNETRHACHTAAVAAEKLGYTDVYIMPQGIAGWVKAGKPVEKA